MIAKKLHFPIFIFLLVCVFTIQSCKKNPDSVPLENNQNYAKCITLAEKYINEQEFDSAFFYYYKIKSTCNPKKDQNKIIYCLSKLAYIQQVQGDYTSSETTATEAITLFQKDTESQYKVSIYNILGINYINIFDYKNSIYYYNQALQESKVELQKVIIKNNIAVVYNDKQDYPTAIKTLLSLTQQKAVIENSETYARVLDNLGRSYFKSGDKKSINYLNQSLNIREKIGDDFGMVASYLHLSEYYNKSNPTLAYDYAQLAYKKATKINSVDDRLESLALLTQNSTEKQSKYYSKKYIRINDSIKKVRQKARNQFAKIKYDSTKEKEENIRLKVQKSKTALELEQQKNSNLLLIFMVTTGILSTIFLYFYLKAVNKKEKLQASYNTETRIAKKLHDELANDVYQTLAFVETQDLSSSQNKEILLRNLDTIYSRTRNISKENSTIDTGANYLEGLKEMMSGFHNESITIMTNGIDGITWNALEDNKKIILFRVIQELLVNMKKHSQCSLSVITFKKNENKLQIDYSDNGLGITMRKTNSGNGLQNVENRILSINGTITFDTKSNKGFKTSFTIPL